MKVLKFITVFISFILCSAAIPLYAQDALLNEAGLSKENRTRLQQLVDSPARSEEARARNQYRHPLPTLDFFDVRPELTVVEIWPGGQGGWYRSILEPYISGVGTYLPVRSNSDFPAAVDNVADNSADRVLVFRAHGFMIYEPPVQENYDAIYRMLKPGGFFGIVDHRGDETVPQDLEGKSGYVNQSHVIMLAEKAGFRLVAESEINANPKDVKTHDEGVYSLPPTLRGSRLNRRKRARMLEIGESDRMTLKFIK